MNRIDRRYARPIPCPAALPGSWPLGGSLAGFREVAVMARGRADEVLPVEAAAIAHPDLAADIARAASAPPAEPGVMAIVNVTPDSFSDGGRHLEVEAAVAFARRAVAHGAAILDVGGESTRPGAAPVPPAEEADRVVPVIRAILAAQAADGTAVPVSIDTRNAETAAAALDAGATILNDVSALTHDPAMPRIAPAFERVCLMHALGDPQTMQADPRYGHVLLDIHDYLAERVAAAEALGIGRARLYVDPGIGFGKRLAHNLALIDGLALFHTLGAPVLLGVSRKRFIGTLAAPTGTGAVADDRAAGSVAAGLKGLDAGAAMLRVHDVAETAQAVAVWRALAGLRAGARAPATEAAMEGRP